MLKNNSEDFLDPSENYRLEFDFVMPEVAFTVIGVCGANVQLSNVNDTNEHSAIVELIDGVAKLYIDGSTTPIHQANVSNVRKMSIRLTENKPLKIKNFKIYEI